jgi:isopenicillin N synthase-like dioxygenase
VENPSPNIPLIHVSALVTGAVDVGATAREIDRACRDSGFFYIVGHGVDPLLIEELERLARAFFAAPLEEKLRVRMELGGRAWRGYFPVGGELTSGRPDAKEGLYFGAELDERDPRVRAGAALFGSNLFPAVPGLRAAVLEYMRVMTDLGHALAEGIALALGLERSFFRQHYTADPLTLFRLFNYPPIGAGRGDGDDWGVGEHTDYGLLTILHQDDTGGLQVKTPAGWIDATPVPGAFVCNIGDMLDRATGGVYRSTPHRVRTSTSSSRLSCPFFFDPSMDAEVRPLLLEESPAENAEERWDKASVRLFHGTYGDYLLAKVSRVFPLLGREVL